MARTVTELIQSSLRAIGVLGSEQTAADDDMSVGLMAFQDLVSEIGGSKIMIPGTTVEPITLVASQSSYTVGEDGSPDLNTIRPEHIYDAFVRDSSGYDHFVEVISENQYNAIGTKSEESRPQVLWYNPTAPNGTVYTHPTPSEAESLYIVSRKPFTEASSYTEDLSADLGIPRNYHAPLKWMLAFELSSEFGVQPSQTVVIRANQGETKITNLNMARRVQGVGFGLPNGRINHRGTNRGTIFDS